MCPLIILSLIGRKKVYHILQSEKKSKLQNKIYSDYNYTKLNTYPGNSLAVQWLELHTLTARDLGETPTGGTKIPLLHDLTPPKKKKNTYPQVPVCMQCLEGYSLKCCQWLTEHQQSNGTSGNIFLSLFFKKFLITNIDYILLSQKQQSYAQKLF